MNSFNRDNPMAPLTTAHDVEWRPYQIDPGTNIGGEEFEAYNIRRWGSSAWKNRLRAMGKRHGALFENWKWWPHTLRCHQLVLLAERHGISTHDANAAIFKAMYEEGQNVSLVEPLVDIAVTELKLPLSREVITAYLTANEGGDEVRDQIQRGRSAFDISGVPYFVIQRTDSSKKPYALSGAQDPATLRKVFENLMVEDK